MPRGATPGRAPRQGGERQATRRLVVDTAHRGPRRHRAADRARSWWQLAAARFGAIPGYARAGTIIGMRVLGVDAYKKGSKGSKGWIGVELDRGAFVRAHIADRLTELLSAVNDIQAAGIDMPLGLVKTGRRQADLDAHAFVGPLCSAVFLMPPRAVWKREDNTWYDDSWEQANQRCRELTRGELSPDGYGLSRQTWGLHVKLREANEYLATDKYPLHEVHPEVSFAAMNGKPLTHRKVSWTGHITRRALLAKHGIHLPDELDDAGNARLDDVLDAAAAAWSAHRIATGHASRLPTEPSSGPGLISIQY
jgi:predicted RNase H-like nuclease